MANGLHPTTSGTNLTTMGAPNRTNGDFFTTLPAPSPGPQFDESFLAARQSSNNSPRAPSVTSKQSNASMYQSALMAQNGVTARNGPKRLRSQYPPNSPEPHVEFILVAAFDIDRGSIMEHQYPGPISGNEHMLAELMLPDQVHSRQQDWTIFFLHKDADPEDDVEDANGRDDQEREASIVEDGDADPLEGPPLVYVLNHVNTKMDNSVRRGAVVKAMAMCTRHSFLDIYKPLLVLAIEEYFRAPTLDTLANLYTSVNSMDLSLVPRLSLLEGIILSASSTKTMFMERFEKMIEQQKDDDPRHEQPRQTLPRDTHEFETRIPYNGHTLPVKIPVAKWPETVGNFSIIKLIQTFAAPHAASAKPFSVHPHLTTGGVMTHPIIVLVNALLTQKRVIFLGHGRPSEEVAEAVLAACALASGGVLRGFTRHAFPYTDLTKIDDLQRVPGFIAGVTNPVFETQHDWWDLLCDLPNGRMTISSKIATPEVTDGIQTFKQQHPNIVNAGTTSSSSDVTGDAVFMDNVLRTINNRLGEGVVRSMWRDWVVKLTRIAATFEEIVYGASALYIGGEQADTSELGLQGHGYVWSDEASRQRELAANVHRIEVDGPALPPRPAAHAAAEPRGVGGHLRRLLQRDPHARRDLPATDGHVGVARRAVLHLAWADAPTQGCAFQDGEPAGTHPGARGGQALLGRAGQICETGVLSATPRARRVRGGGGGAEQDGEPQWDRGQMNGGGGGGGPCLKPTRSYCNTSIFSTVHCVAPSKERRRRPFDDSQDDPRQHDRCRRVRAATRWRRKATRTPWTGLFLRSAHAAGGAGGRRSYEVLNGLRRGQVAGQARPGGDGGSAGRGPVINDRRPPSRHTQPTPARSRPDAAGCGAESCLLLAAIGRLPHRPLALPPAASAH
ncbi:hypothetical protein FH972_023846 [Carpinus fangiana]|uniref:UDENN domain-containing protein n=1 Tax=Carpinus fangiana TaxID=176857 RepID=A0A5N6KX52_9ROSI|nr:hypothetical protein FH972_023846 [Carpinus fangiana]